MKKTMKILSLILALVMSVSVFAVLPAFAVENTDYTVSNDSNTGKTTYTVKTATGLKEVVALVNAADSSNVIITLANDITFMLITGKTQGIRFRIIPPKNAPKRVVNNIKPSLVVAFEAGSLNFKIFLTG